MATIVCLVALDVAVRSLTTSTASAAARSCASLLIPRFLISPCATLTPPRVSKWRTALPDRVRVGFVGAGRLAARVHYPSLAAMPDVDLVAIAELDEGRLTSLADRYHVRGRYADYRAMLEHETLDAVYVIMPPQFLFDIAVDALTRSKHLFIEKPPGVTTYQTQALAWHASNHGCHTMVGFNRRFVPLLVRARELVTARGPIHLCQAAFHKHEASADQFGFYRGAASHLTSDIIHAVDTLRWFAGGEAVAVASDNRAVGMPFPNSHNALIAFDSGCTGILTATRHGGARRHTFELHGEHISVYSDDQHHAAVYADGLEEPQRLSAAELAGSDEGRVRFGYFHESRHFIDCVKAGVSPATNFADAAKTMGLLDRIVAAQI